MADPRPFERLADSDDLSAEGDIITEGDLIDESDLLSLGLADGVDQEWLLGELWKDLLRGEQAEAIQAEADMRRAIEFNQRFEHGFTEGLGQTLCRVPLSVYNHWVARYGHEFWHHRDSIDFIARKAGGEGNPGFLIKSRGKPMFMVDGFRDGISPEPAGLTSSAVASGGSGHGRNPEGGVKASPSAIPPARRPKTRGRGRWAA